MAAKTHFTPDGVEGTGLAMNAVHLPPLLRFILLAFTTLVAAAIPATAQGTPIDQPTALVIYLDPFDGPLNVSEPRTMEALVEFTYFSGAAALNPNGFRVDFHVARAPSWAQVTLEHDTIIFTPIQPPASQTIRQTETFTIMVVLAKDAPELTYENVQIDAAFSGGLGARPSATFAEFPIAADGELGHADDCPEHAETPGPVGSKAPEPQTVSPVTPQSLGTTGLGGSPLALALLGGVAGAACGILVARRLRRR